MSELLKFVNEYWALVIVVMAFVSIAITTISNFTKQPSEQKLDSVKAWLLSAVVLAEKEFGSGTGALKLSNVYGQFVQKFPAIATMITFDRFSGMVDEVLVTFHSMLESNKKLEYYVQGDVK